MDEFEYIRDDNNFISCKIRERMDKSDLKEADQEKINHLITTFGKTQANLLKFSELFMLLLDRGIFSHRFTFAHLIRLFELAQNIKNKKSLDKQVVQGERILGRQQLLFIFNEIAKLLYRTHPTYQEKFYNEFLSEKVDISEGEYQQARVPVFEEANRKIFVEEAIRSLAEYEEELHNVYNLYLLDNYFTLKKTHRILLNSREILLQNKRWTFTSLIHYMKESETTPHIITIDHIEQILKQVIPSISSKQQEFYSRHVLVDTYHKEGEQHENTSHLGDPGMFYHEFLLLVARIAYETYPKELDKKNIGDVINRYFKYLFLRSDAEIKEVPLPSLNRKMITRMKQFYRCLETDADGNKSRNSNKVEAESEDSPINVLIKRINKQVLNAPEIGLDFGEIVKSLEKQLPKLPPVPKVEPEDPPPYVKANAITLGQQPPPEPVNNDKGAKVEKKGGEKGEVPAKVFPWQQMPQNKTAIEDHLKSIQNKITFEVQPLHDIQRGTIRKESHPIIIGEILFPGELPKSVVPHLKEASDALNDRNFVLALECYEMGLKAWKKTAIEIDPSGELFFQYSKGNIYLSIGRLDYALQAFYGCRRFADTSKLPFINPDRSLPYFGLGQVFFEMQEYQLSARAFLKAREIRQNVLGLQHVQTGTVFNNLGCCFFLLGRSHQALGYIQISQVVLDTELGEHHERTMISRSNLKKITNGTFDNHPEYRKFWEVFEEDKFEKKKKKKASGDAKGKKK